MNDDLVFGSSSKSILRQSRLQFASVLQPATTIANSSRVAATNTESLFSSNLSSSSLNRNAIPCKHPTNFNTSFQFCEYLTNAFVCLFVFFFPSLFFQSVSNTVCGVCATPAAITHQSRKYGISSCESCRKFISKTVKRLSLSDEKEPVTVFQCKKGDGNCVISVRSFKASKKRCQACLLLSLIHI